MAEGTGPTLEVIKAQTLLQALSPVSVIAGVGLGLFCVCADRFLALPLAHEHLWLRAVSDNAVHGIVGFWSWAIVTGLRKRDDLYQALLAGCFSSAIDLDHFYSAGSLSLKAAVSLPRRPPLHCSTVIPTLCCFSQLLISVCQPGPTWWYSLPWLLFLSLTSHHVRDGTRRGLWVWPLGSSPPLPYWLYVAVTISLPHLCFILMYLVGSRDTPPTKDNIGTLV